MLRHSFSYNCAPWVSLYSLYEYIMPNIQLQLHIHMGPIYSQWRCWRRCSASAGAEGGSEWRVYSSVYLAVCSCWSLQSMPVRRRTGGTPPLSDYIGGSDGRPVWSPTRPSSLLCQRSRPLGRQIDRQTKTSTCIFGPTIHTCTLNG